MRAMIDHLDYWERAINMGEYRRDGLLDATPSHADEYHLPCPECNKILSNDIKAARKFLKDQPITENNICPEDH